MRLTRKSKKRRQVAEAKNYIITALTITIVSTLCWFFIAPNSYHVVSFILLFVVSILATFMSTISVLIAATLSAMVWNYFFIPPHFTFNIEKTEDILFFIMFFIIALVNGILTTRVRQQEKLARSREENTKSLFQLTKKLSIAKDIDEVISISSNEINSLFGESNIFLLQNGENKLCQSSRIATDLQLNNKDISIAEKAFIENTITGAHTKNFSNNELTFYPLKANILSPGVLIIKHKENPFQTGLEFWNTFITLISNTLEREFLRELAEKARFLDESDRLYKTIFNSISHEFRIPVATIMGASESLTSNIHQKDIQDKLSSEIYTAAIRLNRLVENLLNMSRLESGRISPRFDWHDINDIINQATKSLKTDLTNYSLELDINKDLPLIYVDFGLFEQVIYNVVLNSIQHSPKGSKIKINAGYNNKNLVIDISDEGTGINPAIIKNIFDKFYRESGNKSGGLGLGLSIVRGFVEAHNGSIIAKNNYKAGTCITITIPATEPFF
ncbi:MAG: DUF4118 domain-containing protein [Bacteroidales bacterium]|nr:DUF4118 domain-containing protein [Bacteroidales bacterium]